MKFIVKKHDIELVSPERLVSGSVGLPQCEFSFDESWEGFAKTAVFASFGGVWSAPLVDDAAVVPWEAFENGRRLRIGVYGIKDDVRLPTVYTAPLLVEQGAEDGEESAEPTPDKWTRLLNAIESGKLKGDPGEVTEAAIISALGYTPANETTEAGRAAERIMAANGGCTISVSPSTGGSLIQALEALTEKGVYTLQMHRGCSDKPTPASGNMHGICHVVQTETASSSLCAWVLLFDSAGRVFTRYISAQASSWVELTLTQSMLVSTLGYAPADPELLSLGTDDDGLMRIFYDGVPVGEGI